MSCDVAFTSSQEEAILRDVGIKEFDGQFNLDQIPLSFNSDFGGQSITNFEEFSKPLEEKVYIKNYAEANVTPILVKDEFEGNYNFTLLLNAKNPGKHWSYSEKLNKVFIHMEEVLPLHFQWTPPIDGLWIRATMVYKLDQHRSQPVLRCPNHMTCDNISNRDIDQSNLKHVIRCVHPASTYQVSPTGHLSVVTPLGVPPAGVANVPVDYKFFCKNSCTSGMNRRPTEIVFTLETEQNEVLGRRKIEVRVCSCPKRDKDKEEKELCPEKPETSGYSSKTLIGKKRKYASLPTATLPGKKILDDEDTRIYNLNLNIVGKANYNAVIKSAHDIMAGAALRTGNIGLYEPYLQETLKHSLSQ